MCSPSSSSLCSADRRSDAKGLDTSTFSLCPVADESKGLVARAAGADSSNNMASDAGESGEATATGAIVVGIEMVSAGFLSCRSVPAIKGSLICSAGNPFSVIRFKNTAIGPPKPV